MTLPESRVDFRQAVHVEGRLPAPGNEGVVRLTRDNRFARLRDDAYVRMFGPLADGRFLFGVAGSSVDPLDRVARLGENDRLISMRVHGLAPGDICGIAQSPLPDGRVFLATTEEAGRSGVVWRLEKSGKAVRIPAPSGVGCSLSVLPNGTLTVPTADGWLAPVDQSLRTATVELENLPRMEASKTTLSPKWRVRHPCIANGLALKPSVRRSGDWGADSPIESSPLPSTEPARSS